MKKRLLIATLLLTLLFSLILTGCNTDIQIPEGDEEEGAFQDMPNPYFLAMK